MFHVPFFVAGHRFCITVLWRHKFQCRPQLPVSLFPEITKSCFLYIVHDMFFNENDSEKFHLISWLNMIYKPAHFMIAHATFCGFMM